MLSFQFVHVSPLFKSTQLPPLFPLNLGQPYDLLWQIETSGSDTVLVPGLAFQVLAASALALGKPVTMLWSSGWTTEWGETRETTWRKGTELPHVVMKTSLIFQTSEPPAECNHVHDPNWHYLEQNCLAKHCPNCRFKESWKKVKPLLFWVVTFWTGLLHSNK